MELSAEDTTSGITTKEQAITVHWAAESTSGRFAPDFSYALADKDCFMHKTWQLGIGIVF